MTTTILDQETEVGKCAYEPEEAFGFRYAEPDYSNICAHTFATLNGKGILRIEHQCYLRHGSESPEQPWIKPEIILEQISGPTERLVLLAERAHDRFVTRVRRHFPQEYFV